jgi:hypothetical protein
MAAMAGKLRLVSALCALLTAGVVVTQTNPVTPTGGNAVDLRSTSAPMAPVSSTIKSPIIATTNPSPFDPCDQIPARP